MNNNEHFTRPGPWRHVPIMLRLHALFGSFSSQFGWLFFGFGMIFAWVFAGNADLSMFTFRPESVFTVQGKVTSVKSTSASENDSAIFEVSYSYDIQKGDESAAEASILHVTGTSYAVNNVPEEGSEVEVEYLASNPYKSRIKGLRQGMFSPAVLLVLIFPLVGIGFIISGLRHGLKANRLFSCGYLAYGRLINRSSTNVTVNDRPVISLTFMFTDCQGIERTANARTHMTEMLEDAEEPLLYDPANPDKAVLLDDLPGEPRIDDNGHFFSAHPKSALLSLIAPTVSIIVHGCYSLIYFFIM